MVEEEKQSKVKWFFSMIFDKKMGPYAFFGILCSIVGASIMYGLYNVAHCNYWVSTFLNYAVGDCLCFILNKTFTFKAKGNFLYLLRKYIINCLLSYLCAYAIALGLISLILHAFAPTVQGNVAMTVGVVLRAGMNYVGQRVYVYYIPKKKRLAMAKAQIQKKSEEAPAIESAPIVADEFVPKEEIDKTEV